MAVVAVLLLVAAACSDDGSDVNDVRAFNEMLAERAADVGDADLAGRGRRSLHLVRP